jgi:hypothetical protein
VWLLAASEGSKSIFNGLHGISLSGSNALVDSDALDTSSVASVSAVSVGVVDGELLLDAAWLLLVDSLELDLVADLVAVVGWAALERAGSHAQHQGNVEDGNYQEGERAAVHAVLLLIWHVEFSLVISCLR